MVLLWWLLVASPGYAQSTPEEKPVVDVATLVSFKNAVASGDPAVVAAIVDFPLAGSSHMVGRSFSGGGATRAEFIAHFQAIFSDVVCAKIATSTDADLVAIELDGTPAQRLMIHTVSQRGDFEVEFSIGFVFRTTAGGLRLVALQTAG